MPAITPHTPIDQHMRDWRHDLHRHPETAYEETRTAAKIAALLHDLGKATTAPEILQAKCTPAATTATPPCCSAPPNT